MAKADLMDLATQERGKLLALLRELDERQWTTESLCPGWTVRDVAVHVVSYDELSKRELVSAFLRGGVRVASVNRVALQRYSHLDSDGVIDFVARCQEPQGLTASVAASPCATGPSTTRTYDVLSTFTAPSTSRSFALCSTSRRQRPPCLSRRTHVACAWLRRTSIGAQGRVPRCQGQGKPFSWPRQVGARHWPTCPARA